MTPATPTTRSTPTATAAEPAPVTSTELTVIPTDLDGEVYGHIRTVDVDRAILTFDKVDWFTGADAEQACAEDSVPPDMRLNEWCSAYYFRDVNPTVRTLTVSPQVVVTTLEGNIPVDGDLASLADRIQTPTGFSRPYRLIVTDGAVTEVFEMYQP